MARLRPHYGTASKAASVRKPAVAAKAAPAPAPQGPATLTTAQARFLRGQAHGLKAMLQLGGKGLTDSVVTEVENALEHHELIKVKIAAEDREARDAAIAELVKRTASALVQRIGHVAILYRPSQDHRQIVLPRA